MKIIIEVEKIKCERCGHIWQARKKDVRQCPKCKTAYFNQKKKDGNKKVQ